jgi:hypothetical protein
MWVSAGFALSAAIAPMQVSHHAAGVKPDVWCRVDQMIMQQPCIVKVMSCWQLQECGARFGNGAAVASYTDGQVKQVWAG